MSASLLSLLADELDTSPEKAKKLLVAMLREVKKRAHREGVRLPGFGTFREEDGRITFEASPSLARAVNHRFEGLESEDLGSAPDTSGDEDETDDEGPNTITLGYQDSDWSPLDAEEASADAPAGESGADTDEFQVPAADEAPDTDEFEAPAPSASDPTASEPTASSSAPPDASETSDDDPAGTTETEELYPFVEDVPEEEEASPEPDAAEPSSPDEHDSLSGIWDDEDEATAEAPDTDGFDPFPDEADAASEPPSSEPAAESPATPDDAPSPQEVDREPADREPASPDTDASDTGSTAARVGVGLLVVLLLGGASWYVLGQRGTVQPPREAFAQLRAQIQPQVQSLATQAQALSTDDLPLVGGSEQSSPSPPDVGTPPSATAEVETESGTTAPTSTTEDPAPPPRLTPSEGGWTVIVASPTQRSAAESLVQKYRAAFPDRRLPIGILTSTVDNQTRYRVGVGQFASRAGAQQLLDEAGAKLPQGAWPLRLR